jgi:hypothetical protein
MFVRRISFLLVWLRPIFGFLLDRPVIFRPVETEPLMMSNISPRPFLYIFMKVKKEQREQIFLWPPKEIRTSHTHARM